MTLYRHFKLGLDWNNCLVKKIKLGCLQLVKTYVSMKVSQKSVHPAK